VFIPVVYRKGNQNPKYNQYNFPDGISQVFKWLVVFREFFTDASKKIYHSLYFKRQRGKLAHSLKH
jgi:hypothetical protein